MPEVAVLDKCPSRLRRPRFRQNQLARGDHNEHQGRSIRNKDSGRRISYANIVATLALFIALGGISYAAVKLPKNSVGAKQIKKNAVKSAEIKKDAVAGAEIKKNAVAGSEVKKDSLGGSDIDESKLSGVEAATLGGLSPDGFVQTTNLVHTWDAMNVGDTPKTLVSYGDISVKMSCTNAAAMDTLLVYAVTGTNGALLESEDDDANPFNTTTLADDSEIGDGLSGAENVATSDTGYDETGFVISSDGMRLINLLEGSSTEVLNQFGHDCIYGATFILKTM